MTIYLVKVVERNGEEIFYGRKDSVLGWTEESVIFSRLFFYRGFDKDKLYLYGYSSAKGARQSHVYKSSSRYKKVEIITWKICDT